MITEAMRLRSKRDAMLWAAQMADFNDAQQSRVAEWIWKNKPSIGCSYSEHPIADISSETFWMIADGEIADGPRTNPQRKRARNYGMMRYQSVIPTSAKWLVIDRMESNDLDGNFQFLSSHRTYESAQKMGKKLGDRSAIIDVREVRSPKFAKRKNPYGGQGIFTGRVAKYVDPKYLNKINEKWQAGRVWRYSAQRPSEHGNYAGAVFATQQARGHRSQAFRMERRAERMAKVAEGRGLPPAKPLWARSNPFRALRSKGGNTWYAQSQVDAATSLRAAGGRGASTIHRRYVLGQARDLRRLAYHTPKKRK